MRFLPVFLLFSLIFFCFFFTGSLGSLSSAPTSVAIDWGSEWLRIVNINRIPSSIGSHLDMVVNEQSNRKTPAAAGFDNDDERVLGEDALASFYKYPNKIITQLKRLIGANIQSDAFKSYSDDFSSWAGQQWSAGPYGDVSLTYSASSPSSSTISINELSAMLLQQCARLSESHTTFQSKSNTIIPKVEDAILVVPAHFTAEQRAIIKEIGEAAGIIIHELINELSAAAIDYGVRQLYNTSSSTPTHTIFYNIGATSTSAALVEYSRINDKFTIKILYSSSDPTVGSFSFDKIIRHYLIDKFTTNPKKKPTGNILSNGRAMAKLLREAKDIKEQLSAGTSASIHVEELFEGLNLNVQLKAEEFIQLIGGSDGELIQKFMAPLKNVVEYAKTIENHNTIDYIELFGGGVRLPVIQNAIKTDFPSIPIGKHLDGDEAAAFGAATLMGNLMSLPSITKMEFIDNTIPVPASSASVLDNKGGLTDRLSFFNTIAKKKKEIEVARNALESYMNECNELLYNPDAPDTNSEKSALIDGLSTVTAFIDGINKDTAPEAILGQLESLKSAAENFRSTIKPKKTNKKNAAEESDTGRGRPKRASNRDKAYAREQLKKEQAKNAEKAKKQQQSENKNNNNQKKKNNKKEDL